MPTMFTVPWRWTGTPRPDRAVIFTSRFDAGGARAGWRLFIRGLRLRRAVLRSPGALGVALRAHPLKGSHYTLSMWTDQDSLLAFAHSRDHSRFAHQIAELGPVRGILLSRDADGRRPRWGPTLHWVATAEPGPYRHQPLASDRSSSSHMRP